MCEVRVSPKNSVKPNIGANELSEALNRVLPFTAKDDNRPVLQCVNFTAKEGKLTLVSADGFRLAIVSLDYDDGEGQTLIRRDELVGVANAFGVARGVNPATGFWLLSHKSPGLGVENDVGEKGEMRGEFIYCTPVSQGVTKRISWLF